MRIPKKRWLGLAVAVFLLGVAFVIPASRWAIVGWVKGESFYRGRPTSYWAEEIRTWRQRTDSGRLRPPFELTAWDRIRLRLLGTLAPSYWRPLWVESAEDEMPVGDPEAAAVALELLADHDESVAQYSCGVLALMRRKCPAAVPALVKLLGHPNLENRRRAAWALAIIGPEGPEAVPALIGVLEEDDAELNTSAASALEKIGPHAKDAIPALLRLLRSERARQPLGINDLTVGDYARAALQEIDPIAATRAGIR
jgi:hypothetical protein